MPRGRRERTDNEGMFWPGYVDVLSTLLLVVTFLLSIFMIAQYYVSQQASGKDDALRRLNRQIAQLTELLSLEKGKGQSAIDELASLTASLASLKAENVRLSGLLGAGDVEGKAAGAKVAALSGEIDEQKKLSSEAMAKVDLLNQQLLALRRQIAALNDALAASESKEKESQDRIQDLGKRLNIALARQVQELQRYRSDFFGRLNTLLAGRKDIRVVGDRFVFQSEVLFPSGQAQMTPEGLSTLDALAAAIIDLEKQIPSEINWSLRVDGHTDIRPIKSPQFPSNWELASARAISVVQYLISRGVAPRHLFAAGFGEFQPLEEGTGEDVLRRNRRIELRLTDR